MKIISFEGSKARRSSKEKAVRHLPDADDSSMKLKREYDEMVQLFEQWYDAHVVGQNKDGSWIYK